MGILKTDEKSHAATAAQAHGTYNAILDQGSEFEGKLSFEGTVRIDGTFKGEVQSDATLIVGETGKVQADIRVKSVVISGEVVGNVEATEKVELCAPGVLRGNIKTPNLIIEEGVVFEGSCHMTSSSLSSLNSSATLSKVRPPKDSDDDGKLIARAAD